MSRKIILSMMVSADGYVESSDPDTNWHNWNDEMSEYMMDFFKTVDLFIYGRKSYEQMIQYWPPLKNDFADIMNKTHKIVHSKTLKSASWNSTILPRVDPGEIHEMKQSEGKNIVIFAGPTIAGEYLKHNLIDEYRMIVNPILLGGGKSFFPNLKHPVELEMTYQRSFQCGNALLCYQTKCSI